VLKMSFPIENRQSTAALAGMNFVNNFISTGSPKKVTSVRTSYKLPSSQVFFTRFCALVSQKWSDRGIFVPISVKKVR